MRLVAGDVGGTKTLLRCVEADGAVSAERRYESADFASFDDVLGDFCRVLPGDADASCFAVAGPVFGARAEVTNLGWKIDQAALARTFPLGRVLLINDFYAVGLGVPLLHDDALLSLHRGTRERSAPIAVLGAGTGLGEAIVIHHGNTHHVIPTEGGHADFAPQDEEQARLFLFLHRRYGHVSWERLLSGMGLVNIFTFLGGEEISAAEIAHRAANDDPRAEHTFEIFVDLYGAEAGNMALRALARGGVYLAGGIAAKNIPWFSDGRFTQAFLRKGRFRQLLDSIPVDLIVDETVGLIGALEGAKRVAAGRGLE